MFLYRLLLRQVIKFWWALLGGACGWRLAALTIPLVTATGLAAQPIGTAASWSTVKDTSLVIESGSPLDFSQWLPAGMAGDQGRVTIGANGRLVFSSQTDKPAKLHCASLAWSPATGGFPPKSMAELYARQLRIHGYNLVRLHYVEATLMSGRKTDFDFDIDQLDRFHFFLAALKREGIYWVIDALSSENGALGNVQPHRWVKQHDLKFKVHVDETAKIHWQALVDALYGRVNPYTGSSVLTDPALVGVILVNEGGLNYLALTRKGGWSSELQAPFNHWLRQRYKNDEAIANAWGGLPSGQSLQAGTVAVPGTLRDPSPKMTDFQRFLTALEANTANWMTAHLRSKGYLGLITSYNNWISTQADATRSTLQWVDMHAYHDEALSFQPGATLQQTSAVPGAARFARWLAIARHAGKPFSVTEYGQPFWNRYRFEAGVLVPAMAALQGWDFACLHAEGAIDLSFYQPNQRKSAIHPYGIGVDPVARAGETLAALLFMRGDVRESSNRVTVDYSGDTAFVESGLSPVPESISALPWLTGVQLTNAKRTAAGSPAGPMIKPNRPSSSEYAAVRSALQAGNRFVTADIQSAVEGLRSSGILGRANKTNPSEGIYQSDTEQLLIDTVNQRFIVGTPLTEAATVVGPASDLKIDVMEVRSVDGAALIAASSLDGAPLRQSRKVLVIFATDAENTDMRFADAQRRQLLQLGGMPPRVLRGTATIALRLDHEVPMQLVSLTLNGRRGDAMAIVTAGKARIIDLDNSRPSHGPTTFFLLEAKSP